MSLTTYRRTGQPVPTPVWFADADGRLYVTTSADSGKVKRLRHTSRVLVAPSRANGEIIGPSVEAQARILPAAEYGAAEAALKRKYGIQWWLLFSFRQLFRRHSVESTFLEIMPLAQPPAPLA